MKKENIIIVTIKEWNILNYHEIKKKFNIYNFYLITNKNDLNINNISSFNPKYIFFPHWSWIIPQEIYQTYECIIFHMTDLPFGRGGSPLQNLIIREIYDTKISAIKVNHTLDAGDIYLKENFNITTGSAEEIFIKISYIVFHKMIPKFFLKKLIPQKQQGVTTIFKRRNSKDSNIYDIKNMSLNKLYDFIRMLDADTYPKAFIKIDNIKIEFFNIKRKNGKLIAECNIEEIINKKEG